MGLRRQPWNSSISQRFENLQIKNSLFRVVYEEALGGTGHGSHCFQFHEVIIKKKWVRLERTEGAIRGWGRT